MKKLCFLYKYTLNEKSLFFLKTNVYGLHHYIPLNQCYFVSSIGNVSEKTIKEYIKKQG